MINLKDALFKFLKDKFVKLALKKLLGSAAAGGFKAWLVKFVAVELFEEVAEPLLKFAIRKGLLFYDKTKGSIQVKKIEEAKKDGDEDAYRDTIGRV